MSGLAERACGAQAVEEMAAVAWAGWAARRHGLDLALASPGRTRPGHTYLPVTSKSHLWNAFSPLSFIWNAWGRRNCFRSSPPQSRCDLSHSAAIPEQHNVSILQSLVEMNLLLLLLCCCWMPQGLLQVVGLSAEIARWNLICWTEPMQRYQRRFPCGVSCYGVTHKWGSKSPWVCQVLPHPPIGTLVNDLFVLTQDVARQLCGNSEVPQSHWEQFNSVKNCIPSHQHALLACWLSVIRKN